MKIDWSEVGRKTDTFEPYWLVGWEAFEEYCQASPTDRRKYFQKIVMAMLQKAAREGWGPDDLADDLCKQLKTDDK